MVTNVALSILSAPIALNDAKTTPKNTSVEIVVLANDLSTTSPLVPGSVNITSGPDNGTTSVDTFGVVTYTPFTGFVGADSFVYTVSDTNDETSQATVYVTVFDPNKPCPSSCPSECCGCFDRVDECLCSEESFGNFTTVSGIWNQNGNHVTTDPGVNTFNFLQYNTQIDQTYEDLEVKILFPSVQTVTSQFISAGLVTNWDGATVINQKVAYISFDNRSGFPTTSKLAVGGLNSTETIFLLPFQIQYDTVYTLRLIKNQLQVFAFIDDMFIGSSNNGLVTGNYIGIWSYQATVEFNDLKSCSYTKSLNTPDYVPFAAADPLAFPVFPT